MVKPCVFEQIKDVEYAITEFPEYEYSLNLHRSILKRLTSIDELPSKGMNIGWEEAESQFLQQIALGKPVISNLDASMFDSQIVLEICQDVTSILRDREIEKERIRNFDKLYETLGKKEIKIVKSLDAVLKGDAAWFEKFGKKVGVESAVLIFIFSISIQPCLEEVARKIVNSVLNQWWQPLCPVCARIPVIAWFRGGKRYLTCSFCGSQYLTDRFLCINCGNTDAYTLGFLTLKDSEFQIDYCEKCRHYLKVIYENKLKRRVPRGLEDYLTQRLDEVAIEAGLRRI